MSKGQQITIENSNLCTLSVSGVVDSISSLVANAIENKMPFKNLPAVMLWGMPGVGKSQAVRQIAQAVSLKTGKLPKVTDVRLLLFNPIDLRGIPVADITKSFAVWLKPKIFDMDPSDDVVNFLFLDEITAAPPSVQAAAYQITLDRVIGEHKLPDNCYVICAGNRTTDKSVAYKMPKALANRLCHFVVEIDFTSWKKWAEQHDIDYRVVNFLSKRRDLLSSFDASSEDVAFATPRSWEMVSSILTAGNYSNLKKCFPLIAGLVGTGVATEFVAWCETNAYIPDIDSIVNGTASFVPNTTDGVFATVQVMVHYVKTHVTNDRGIENCVEYAKRFSPDVTALFFKHLSTINKNLLLKRSISDWIKSHARYFYS